MTDHPTPFPISDDDDRRSRRHALWALLVLGCLALIVGCLMVLLGGGGGEKPAVNLLPPVQTPTQSPSTSHGPTSRASTGHAVAGLSTSAGLPTPADSLPTSPAGPVRRGDPCPTSAPCVVDGDGGALAAVDAYRSAHGMTAVPGGVTTNAQVCARRRGTGPTCVPHYAWTSLGDQDGAKAVAKIASFGSGWLLDPKTTAISVGWAYVGGQYECVLLKAP